MLAHATIARWDVRSDHGGLVLAATLAGLFTALAFAHGGFEPTAWLAAALFLLFLLAVVVVARPRLLRSLPAPTVAATSLLGSFAAWSYLSILWAGSRGVAWDGANRTLLYTTVFALVAIWPWRPASATAIVTGFAVGATAAALVAVEAARRSDDPLESFYGSRFADPLGYHNASAAVLLVPALAAAVLASRRELPLLLRPLLLATAAMAAELAVLPQSRASVGALVVAVAVSFLVVPGRLRLLVGILPVAIAVLVTTPTLLDVFQDARSGDPTEALGRALAAVLVSGAVVFVVGLALAVGDRRVVVAPAAVRAAGVAVVGVLGLSLAVGAVWAVRAGPVERVGDAWESFRESQPAATGATYYTSGLGSNRYDFWRVALEEFAQSPVAGTGAENFAVAYLRERKSDEEPRYVHSLELEVLSGTGLVGGALLAGFFGAVAWSAVRVHRHGAGRWAAASASIVAAVYWLAHASVDWLWQFPALTGVAFALLGVVAGLARPAPTEPRDGGSRRVSRTVAAVGGVVAFLCAASLAAPWLAAREVDAATAVWRGDPAAALERLERARKLNPLSERPDLVAGAIASRTGDWETMRAAFERAVERNSGSWYAELELAAVASVTGRYDDARRHLARAETLNPREPALRIVRAAVRAQRPIHPDVLDRLFVERFELRTT